MTTGKDMRRGREATSEKLQERPFHVGMAGVGGIGSTVAQLLVRCGVSRLTLVDFDRVDAGNLNRQFYFHDQVGRYKVEMLVRNLTRINPRVTLTAFCERLTSRNIAARFCDCDVIVEGVDDKCVKKQVVEAFAGTSTPVVCASGIAGTDLSAIQVKNMGNITVVGDLVTDEANTVLFPPKVHMVAARMAGEILNQLHKL